MDRTTRLMFILRCAVYLIVVLAAPTVVLQPFRCGFIETTALKATMAALNHDQYIAARTARHNLEMLRPCLCATRESVNLYMVAAANERILKRLPEAEALYLTALEYDRRPELFVNLGKVQLEEGKRREALESLYRAGRFQRSLLYDGSLPPEVAATVQKRVSDEEERLRRSH